MNSRFVTSWRCFGLFRCLLVLSVLATLVSSHGASSTGPLVKQVGHTPKSPASNQAVRINLSTESTVQSALLEYQVVEPGSYVALKDKEYQSGWVSLPMLQSNEGKGLNYTASVPAEVQTHRRLVRYRFRLTVKDGSAVMHPSPQNPEPNFGYFVYDAVPAWRAAIDPQSRDPKLKEQRVFPNAVMTQVQSYHLIARQKEIENATWYQPGPEKEYLYTGTFVADGEVYDHVRFRPRGGVWRHAMGKNMWKIDFNKGHKLQARDDYGRPYRAEWSKLNLRACIQQGDYGRRGEQGMYESVGFRLFNLAGVPAPRTHWISLRIVGEREESPADQYRGDFWGLYLAIENEDGQFLQEHRLPDGNLYKIMGGDGEVAHLGANQVTNRSDVHRLLSELGGSRSVDWCRTNLHLAAYYSYRTLVEGIHHYDISDGKNYNFYRNPTDGCWTTIPWDIDLTWGDHMYGGGYDPWLQVVTGKPELAIEYRNRIRELRDLLFNPQETGRLIDECAALIANPAGGASIVDADRAKWDFHPIMNSRYSMQEKAGKGRFYGAVASRDFAGMVKQMKDYVVARSAVLDRICSQDSGIPDTPKISYTGAPGFPPTQLVFSTSAYSGSKPFAALQWRVGEVARPAIQNGRFTAPGSYEVAAVWESEELREFRNSIQLPAGKFAPGANYRVRARMQDRDGRWGHWSEPVEFRPGSK